ncbi:MAG: 30S ribosomal protein S9 [Myxococcales bacterium]|nr:MAG: 30S ribosomal protein S9 [Myxococcales bacterium]
MASIGWNWHAVGKRKTAIARVWMRPGSGMILINGRKAPEYLRRAALEMIVNQPLELTESEGRYDIVCNCQGGGLAGQALAIKHGISRALLEVDTDKYRPILKKAGFLTRDARIKERKKYGLRAARRRYQFSKR